MSIPRQSLDRITTSLCPETIPSKILAGCDYGARAYIYRGSSVAEMELSSPQCVLLALLYSLVIEDIMSCCFLADLCHHLQQLQSDYLKVWLAGDFVFPREDMEKALALLTRLLEADVLKLPPHVIRVMTSLVAKYRLHGTKLISPSEGGGRNSVSFLEEAVVNNSPGDIIAAAFEGGDVDGTTQAGDSLVHLAARLGNCFSIAALAFLKADLETSNSNNETPLEEAVRNNRSSSVKALLSSGANVDKSLFLGDTYLHTAATGGQNEALAALINTGRMDVNKKNHLGETPIFQAVRAGNVRGVEILLEKRADAGILPEGSKSLIEIAVESQNIEILKVLLKEGANLEFKDGDSIFHVVARSGNLEMLNVIKEMSLRKNCNQNGLTPLHLASDPSIVKTLNKMGLNANDKTKKGETALYLASAKGSLELVRALYQGGAAVDMQDDGGTSPLMIAIKNLKEEVATFLLHNGGDPNTKDRQGRTPLHYAAEVGCAGMVATLLYAGARVNEPDSKGNTPAFLAAASNKTAVLMLLVENGADLALRDRHGNGILQRAASNGDAEAVTALLDAGAEVNMVGQGMWTALHWAAEGGHTAAMEALIDREADLEARTGFTVHTPLMIASAHGHLGAVQLLVGRGAQLNAKNINGWTALKWANNCDHKAVVDYLRSKGGVE